MAKNRIEQRRRELNISKDEICKAVGICLKSYYLYIGGKPIPSDKLVRFADILECSTDYLLGIKE